MRKWQTQFCISDMQSLTPHSYAFGRTMGQWPLWKWLKRNYFKLWRPLHLCLRYPAPAQDTEAAMSNACCCALIKLYHTNNQGPAVCQEPLDEQMRVHSQTSIWEHLTVGSKLAFANASKPFWFNGRSNHFFILNALSSLTALRVENH